MKILQIVTKSSWGGAQRGVYDLSVGLVDEGHEITVIFGEDGNDGLTKKLNELNINWRKINSLGRDIKIFVDIKAFFEIRKIIKEIKPEVVHCHSSKAGLLGTLASKSLFVKKIIFTAHGTPFLEERNILSRFIIKKMSELTVVLSNKTICVSTAVYNAYPDIIMKRKGVVIHNGISEFTLYEKSIAKQKLDIDSEYTIGTISELHKNKGLLYLIEAVDILVKQNINIKCFIFGGGDQEKQLAKEIQKRELCRNIILLGFVEDASTYLKIFDTFVLSSIVEGLPYVILEAGYAGIPIVGTDVGGVKEIIENGKNGILVEPKNSVAISEAVHKLYLNNEMRILFSREIKSNIENKFFVKKMLQKTILLYK